MSIKTSIPLAVIALLAAGCSPDNGNPPSTTSTVSDSAGIHLVSSFAPIEEPLEWRTTAQPIVSIGELDGDEPYLLSRVLSGLKLEDGRIVLSDSRISKVRFYDASGIHVRSIGDTGSGPGEFALHSSMHLFEAHNSLYVADENARRVAIYSTDGEYERMVALQGSEEAPRPFLSGVFDDGTWLGHAAVGGGVLRGDATGIITIEMLLLSMGEPPHETTVVHRYPERSRVVNEVAGVTNFPYVPLTSSIAFKVDGNTVLINTGGSGEIVRFSSSGDHLATYRWSPPRTRVSDVWSRYVRAELEGLDEEDHRQYSALYEMDLPLPEFIPVVQSIRVDPDHNIWVERYALPWESTRTHDVLTSDGHWLGSVETPPNFDIFQIGTDFILGRSRGEDLVERIQVYGLNRQE